MNTTTKVFGKSLGATGHHENCRIAFKWEDATHKTKFLGVRIRPTRSGILSLTALFTPVMIDGSKVQKATLHNVDIFRKLQLGIGDELEVYKANMIIPAVAKNNTKSGTYKLPDTCPCCGGKAVVEQRGETNYLVCTNSRCSAKRVRQFEHFCARTYMEVSGMAGATLEALVDDGFIKTFADIYHLDRYKEQIIALDGFGKRSYEKLQDGVEASRDAAFSSFLLLSVRRSSAAISVSCWRNSLAPWMRCSRPWTMASTLPLWRAWGPRRLPTWSPG